VIRTGQNHKGFSLIEALVGLALIGFSVSMVATVTSFSARSQRFTRALNSQNDLISEIKMIVNSEAACTANFRGIHTPNGTDKSPPLTVYAVDHLGNRTTEILAARGTVYESAIEISEIYFQRKMVLPNGEQLLRLILETRKTGDIAGPSASVAEIPVLASVDSAGDILGCQANFRYNGLTHVEEKICQLSGMLYDPVAKRCIPPVTCAYGTAASATCTDTSAIVQQCMAAGYTPATTRPLVERLYADGSTIMDGPADYLARQTSPNTCSCVYASGVEVTSTTQCIACCKSP
jgi:type II secretory pathway pseudopilin PulG